MTMAAPLTIVYFGTAAFAVPPLRTLAAHADRFRVALVISQPDRPAGRKNELRSPAVAEAAKTLGLPLLQPERLKDDAAFHAIRDAKPDLLIVAAYGRIVPKRYLEIPRIAPLNLHGSLLPKYRGASPIQAAILAGERETGVSLMVMDEEVDHGPVVAATKVAIAPDDTHATLEKKLGEASTDLVLRDIPAFASGTLKAADQDHSQATFTTLIDREDGSVRWPDENAAEIGRKVRAYDPWPGVFAVWQRHGVPTRLKLIAVAPDARVAADASPGTVALADDGYPAVRAKDAWLALRTVQLEGKKPTDAKAFLNGAKDLIGSTL